MMMLQQQQQQQQKLQRMLPLKIIRVQAANFR
jgi:hypothetical protein